MAEPYRWSVRDADARLVRRLRVLALQRGESVATLLNQALAEFLTREEGKDADKTQPPVASSSTKNDRGL
jgi:hypothetical protein